MRLKKLTLKNSLLVTDDDEPGVLEDLRSQICDNIGLYAHKYEDEFQPFMQQFVTAVWNLLPTTGLNKYDLLVSNAIQFLASVACTVSLSEFRQYNYKIKYRDCIKRHFGRSESCRRFYYCLF